MEVCDPPPKGQIWLTLRQVKLSGKKDPVLGTLWKAGSASTEGASVTVVT